MFPRKAKVPVASQSVKAKASAKGGLDRKFGYHSRLPILETICKYEQNNRLKTVKKNQDGSRHQALAEAVVMALSDSRPKR